jgi:cytochrome b
MSVKVGVWDWPLRLFHWLLVLAVSAAYITGQLGGLLTDWHAQFGSLVLGLLVFRLIWGIVGSRHSRFASFFPGPSKLSAYFSGRWQGVGHNPLGALMILLMLLLLVFQALTGLFANDDIAFEGPLCALIDKELSDKLSGLHGLSVNVLLVLVVLHVGAILYYLLVKKNNLIMPMITGKKTLQENLLAKPAATFSKWYFILAVTLAVACVYTAWHQDLVKWIIAFLKP